MAERVETGGLKSFNYNDSNLELDEERKRAIEEGYAQAAERKKREKRNRMILWIVVAMIVLGIIGFLVY